MWTFWTEFRRSPLRWWLPVLIIVDVASLFGRNRYWIGVWPQASAAAQVPCAMFFGPAVAAGAAWSAGRTARRGVADLVLGAARPPWLVELVQFTATLAHCLIAYALGAALAAAVSSGEAGPGFLWPGYLLLGLAVLVLSAAIGHAAGRWSTSRFTAPAVSAMGVFILVVWVNDLAGIRFSVLSGDPQVTVSGGALVSRLALALVLSAAALTFPALVGRLKPEHRPSGLRRLGALATALALAGSLVAVGGAGALVVDREPPRRPLCSSSAPQVCVWPENRKYLPEITAMAQRLARLPGDLFTVPGRFREQGLGGVGPESIEYFRDFRIIEGSYWSVAGPMALEVLRATIPVYCDNPDDAAEQHQILAISEVSIWLQAHAVGPERAPDFSGGPPGVDIGAVRAVAAGPRDRQIAWVKERLKTIEVDTCA